MCIYLLYVYIFLCVHVYTYNVVRSVGFLFVCLFCCFFCEHVSVWISQAAVLVLAALTFPDENRSACPLVLTYPHTIKAC